MQSYEEFHAANEKVIKKKVVKNGKKQIVYKTDKEGYKMDGKKEVKMDQSEVKARKKAAKKAAKTRKKNPMAAKKAAKARAKTMKKKKALGI